MKGNSNGWGGRREGAGRKRAGDGREVRNRTISICGTTNEIDKLKSLAAEKKLSVSRYVIDSLVNRVS